MSREIERDRKRRPVEVTLVNYLVAVSSTRMLRMHMICTLLTTRKVNTSVKLGETEKKGIWCTIPQNVKPSLVVLLG